MKDDSKWDLLARVAKRLPLAKEPEYLRAKSVHGDIRMAIGRGPNNAWYGLWGAKVGSQTVARSSSAGENFTRKQFIQGLFDDAVFFMKEAEKRHMTDEGWWKSARVV